MHQTTEPLFNRGFRLLLRYIRLFLLLTVSCAAIAFAISYAFTAQYKADITLVPTEETLGTDESSIVGGLASLVGAGQLGSKESEALAILKSRGLIWSYIPEQVGPDGAEMEVRQEELRADLGGRLQSFRQTGSEYRRE